MDVVERLTLEAARARSLLACTHQHRYRLAGELCAGRRTVDLCCGSGYGSAILSERSTDVLGVDLDAATIDMAQATLGRQPGLSFLASDATGFLESGGADHYEALVCFEGIEHVADLERLTAQLVRLAAKGLVLVLSIPNSEAFEEDNAYHVTDFGPEAFTEFAGRFPDAQVLRQYTAEGSVILPDEDAAEGRVVLRDRIEPEWANHFLLMVNAPDGVEVARSAGLLQVEAAPLHNRYVRDLEEANRRLMRENARLVRGRLGHHAAAAGTRLDRLRESSLRIEELEERVGAMEAVVPFLSLAYHGGWHEPEEAPEGVAFRWSGTVATLTIGRDATRRPPLDLYAVSRAFLRERNVSVRSEGTEIDTLAIPSDRWEDITIRLPAGEGKLVVEMVVQPAADTASTVNPADERILGIALGSPLLIPIW